MALEPMQGTQASLRGELGYMELLRVAPMTSGSL